MRAAYEPGQTLVMDAIDTKFGGQWWSCGAYPLYSTLVRVAAALPPQHILQLGMPMWPGMYYLSR